MFCTVSGSLDSAKVPFTVAPYLVLCCQLFDSPHMTHGGDLALCLHDVSDPGYVGYVVCFKVSLSIESEP